MTNAVVALAIETVKAGYGALIFCSGRQGCQSMASLVGQAMPTLPGTEDEVLDKREDVIGDLRSLAVGLDETLGITVMQGVAFHRTFQILQCSAFVG
jgi:replicative superfamily II helicase